MSDELIGWELDFEVAKALGLPLSKDVWHGDGVFVGHGSGEWEAFIEPILDFRTQDPVGKFSGAGPTPLIAAMRAFVASKAPQ